MGLIDRLLRRRAAVPTGPVPPRAGPPATDEPPTDQPSTDAPVIDVAGRDRVDLTSTEPVPVVVAGAATRRPFTAPARRAGGANHPSVDLRTIDLPSGELRAWGRQHGFAVSAKGRIPRQVLEAYAASRHG